LKLNEKMYIPNKDVKRTLRIIEKKHFSIYFKLCFLSIIVKNKNPGIKVVKVTDVNILIKIKIFILFHSK
jgi:hypothetical protein